MDSDELYSKYSKLSVLVYGDMCLDKDYIGMYSGFSRELEHLPIFRSEVEKYNPGGGGNLAVCFSALGVKTAIAGIWGDKEDINRYILESSFRKRNIDTSDMVEGSRTPTFGKVYLNSGAHIYRIDLVSEPIPDISLHHLADRVKKVINSFDFVACADYEEANEYGVCSQEVLNIIADSPLPKFGTSRSRIRGFKGFNHLLQNTKELSDQTSLGKSVDLETIVEDFLRNLEIDELVVTMGGKGATSFCMSNGVLKAVPVSSVELREKIDPCGCGDMFFAAYASSVMAGFDVQTSLKIANSAARVVARKLFGTGQANPEEIAKEYKELYST